MSTTHFYASGKFLLFGEYLVLREAKALAVPLNRGQQLRVNLSGSENIIWECYEQDSKWLRAELAPALEIVTCSNAKEAEIIRQLLLLIRDENPDKDPAGLHFRFDIDFPRKYGLGTSSTFLSLTSQWAGVNPYLLQKKLLGGSGYDIAAATAKGPIIYQLRQGNEFDPLILPVALNKNITSKLLFVYTGKKQSTAKEVSGFHRMPTSKHQIEEMNRIVEVASGTDSIEEFESAMVHSEKMLSAILMKAPLKESLFAGYPFCIKSLGAWGGDFAMATFREEGEALSYFRDKGVNPVFAYDQIVKNGG